MIKAFYTGSTGMIEHQKMMSAIANNVANIDTQGYKASRLTFQELLYQKMRMPDAFDTGDEVSYNESKLSAGAGGRVAESAIEMTQGVYYVTDSALDVLIDGDAFFAVEGIDGEVYYTRDGSFQVSLEDEDRYLVTSDGAYVLNADYERILVPDFFETVKFVPQGYDYAENDENVIEIGLFSCNNIYGLEQLGINKYATTANSGEMEPGYGENVKLISGALERSNVSLAVEMTRSIRAQRAFQVNASLIRTADEIEAYTNNLRG